MPDVSLKDVAARAGVSFQTVSKVLNGKPGVALATQRRVMDAAEALGYVPNVLARSLQTRTTHTLGVVTTDFSNTNIARHLVGIERQARCQGLSVIVSSVSPDGADCDQRLRTLLERRVDGVLINAPLIEDDPRVGKLLAGTPAVALHRVTGDAIPVVHGDAPASATLPLRHLLTLGHRRIAMVTGDPRRGVTRVRTATYHKVLEEAGIPPEPDLVEEGGWSIGRAHDATHRLLDRAPDLTAVYAQNDDMAIGVLNALHERGRRVPEDVSVVGCDDIEFAAHTIPPLTTVHVPFHESGEAAVRLLVRLIETGETPQDDVTLPVRLVYRSSTQAPSGAPPAPATALAPDHAAAAGGDDLPEEGA